jgi:hypothetical protein
VAGSPSMAWHKFHQNAFFSGIFLLWTC